MAFLLLTGTFCFICCAVLCCAALVARGCRRASHRRLVVFWLRFGHRAIESCSLRGVVPTPIAAHHTCQCLQNTGRPPPLSPVTQCSSIGSLLHLADLPQSPRRPEVQAYCAEAVQDVSTFSPPPVLLRASHGLAGHARMRDNRPRSTNAAFATVFATVDPTGVCLNPSESPFLRPLQPRRRTATNMSAHRRQPHLQQHK